MSQPLPDTESKTLLAYLNAQRKHVIGILEGLDEEALRRPVMPSGWSCLGLVRHLTLDDERFWFRAIVAGDQSVIDQVAEAPDDAWQVGPDVPVEAVFDMYQQQIALLTLFAVGSGVRGKAHKSVQQGYPCRGMLCVLLLNTSWISTALGVILTTL